LRQLWFGVLKNRREEFLFAVMTNFRKRQGKSVLPFCQSDSMFKSIHFNAKPRAVTNASKPEVTEKLKQIVGAENVLVEPKSKIYEIESLS
jgi:hypothetical protein